MGPTPQQLEQEQCGGCTKKAQWSFRVKDGSLLHRACNDCFAKAVGEFELLDIRRIRKG
ncbi:MAG: hypothetical protein AB7P69_03735 [Candidatus Binatia bacterium]